MLVNLVLFGFITVGPWTQGSDSVSHCGANASVSSTIRVEHFVDLSSEGWEMAIDNSGDMRVTTTNGAQNRQLTSREVSSIWRYLKEQGVWSLPPSIGAPSEISFQRIEVCLNGRRHATVNYYRGTRTEITAEDLRFARMMVKLRRLFKSEYAADFKEAEALIRRIDAKGKKPSPR